MSAPLEGAFAKLNRAQVHLSFLQQRAKSLLDPDSYSLHPEFDPNTREAIIYGEALREPPTTEWGVIIGDVVHNLRSALDHLVWGLTLDNGNVPPTMIPRGSAGRKWRAVSFPIYTKPYPVDHRGRLIPWVQSKEPNSLWGVRPSLRADFQNLQPFNYGQSAPQQPLAILEELWNIDKHRHLHLTHFFVGLDSILPGAPEVSLMIAKKHPEGPFEGRTEIGRFWMKGLTSDRLPTMPMNLNLSFDIAFGQGSPAYGTRVIKTLESLHDEVTAILVKFEPEFT